MRQVKISGESGMVSSRAEDVSSSLKFKGGAQIQKGAYTMSAAQDLKSFGASLQDVSRNISNVQKKANQSLTKNQIAKEQADMKRDFSSLDIDNANTLNEEETYNNTKNLYDKYNDKLQTDEFTVESRNHLKQVLESYNTSSISKYASSRASAETKAALAINKQSLEDYMVEGDVEGLNDTLSLGIETGLYTESQAQVLAVSYNNDMVMNEAVRTLNTTDITDYDGTDGSISMDDVYGNNYELLEQAKGNGLSGTNLLKVEEAVLKKNAILKKQQHTIGNEVLKMKKAGNTVDALIVANRLPDSPFKLNLMNDIEETLEDGYAANLNTLISNANTEEELDALVIRVAGTAGFTDSTKEAMNSKIVSRGIDIKQSADVKFDKTAIGKLYIGIKKGTISKEYIDVLQNDGKLNEDEAATARALAVNKLYEEQEAVKISGRNIVKFEIRRDWKWDTTVNYDFPDEASLMDSINNDMTTASFNATPDGDNPGELKLVLTDFGDDIGNVPGNNTLNGREVIDYFDAAIATLPKGLAKDELRRQLNDMMINPGNQIDTNGQYIVGIKDQDTIKHVYTNGLKEYNIASVGLNPLIINRDRNLIKDALVDSKTGKPIDTPEATKIVNDIIGNAQLVQAQHSLQRAFAKPTEATKKVSIGTISSDAARSLFMK